MTQFSDLNLDPQVLRALTDAGYETPTPIQADAIPPALEGRDVLGIAQTGTGKTAAFVLPMISRLSRGRARARMPRSLVLCPTRELAAQVAENFDAYTKYLKLTKALLIGGVSFKEQEVLIDRGVDVLIATPGRLLDHFERGKLLLTGVQVMVVDEADRMLDMGFIPDIERIFNLTPFTRQTLFFSATMAPEIERITKAFLQAPARVEVARAATAAESIAQGVVAFAPTSREGAASEKRALLRAMIDAEGAACTNAIVFCNRKSDVDILAKSLRKYGYDAEPIHGDLEQSQRMRTLDGFREGKVRFLIASDVAARGLDIPEVTHVFQFDVPTHSEDYVHRIGRTGRAGRSGKALMIAGPRDDKLLEAIEKLLQKPIPRVEAPQLETRPSRRRRESADTAEAARPARRSRSRSERPAPEGKPESKAESKPESKAGTGSDSRPARKPAPAREEAATAPGAAPQPPRSPAPEKAAEKPARRPESGHERGHGRGRAEDVVVGLGDDTPAFIRMSFAERRAG